jgi:hypothetical protein
MSAALSTPHAHDPRPLRVERLDLRRRAERLRFYEAERACRADEGGFRPHFRRDALYWMDPAGSPALERADSLALCASRGAEVVGRVLAVRPPGAVDGLFSSFCCRDDEGAARALIERCGSATAAALTMHGDSVGVCQASLACLRSLATRPDNRASLCTALQQVRVRVSSGLEFSSMMRRPWGCDSSCSKPCSLDMRHGREGGAAHGSCSACA